MDDEREDQYVSALRTDRTLAQRSQKYFAEKKSGQQEFLEHLLEGDHFAFSDVADVACGGGALSFWLSRKYPQCRYTLIDLNPDFLSDAANLNEGRNFRFVLGNIYDLKEIPDDSFDLTCCWQTLSWLEQPEKALQELVRITKRGGRIYASSLFNAVHDVDIFSRVLDWTRDSTRQGHYAMYNTYSMKTVRSWIQDRVDHVELFDFELDVDLTERARGLGTYTVKAACGKRLQISAGILLNWGVLKIIK